MKLEMGSIQRTLLLCGCIIAFLFFIVRSRSYHQIQNQTTRFGVVLDAGSTGSRIHVYQFLYTDEGPQIMSEVFEQTKPGLSFYAGKPEKAAESLLPLLEIAKNTIPDSARPCTPMVLKATAGLRLLPGNQSNEILAEVHRELKRSGFFIPDRAVEIMDGTDEGVFAWITVNFLLGRLGKQSKKPTVAIMDLGGGSTQIVLETSTPMQGAPKESVYELQFGSFKYQLYQHSYLGYGLMESRKKIKHSSASYGSGRVSNCLPVGFSEDFGPADALQRITGKAGTAEECISEAKTILNDDAQCDFSSCSFNGVFQPLPEDFPAELYAFSYFYDRTESMDTPFPSSVSVIAYQKEATKFCGKNINDPQVKQVFVDNPHICMDLSYLYALLKVGYDLPDKTRLNLAKKIKGYETGWCMGAMMKVLDEHNHLCQK